MRAIGSWMGIGVKNFFKDYYRILGSIRDTQLLLSKIKKGEYVVPTAFADWLETGLHHLKAEWQRKYHLDVIKKQFAELEKSLDNSNHHPKKHALNFEKDKNVTLTSFIHERPLSDEQIHSGRKTVKQIDFLNRWEKKNSDVLMKKLSDETGYYMDRISAIRLLEQYLTEEADESKKNETELLLEKWKQDKEDEKRKLLENINSLSA